MSCGMVPDGLAFQFGRNGVSLTLSFLSLRHWSISSSQLLAGALIPAWASIGSLYMRTNRLVKYGRSEEHTSELQSRLHLVCRLLLEKKKNNKSHLQVIKCEDPTV